MDISPGPIAAGAKLMAARDSSGDYDTDFANYVQALGLKYFKPYEVYRSPEYNKKIAGATHSEHMNFTAIDFQVKANSGPAEWAGVLRQMRQSGLFKGGIGVYPSFVHVDTRGVNRDW